MPQMRLQKIRSITTSLEEMARDPARRAQTYAIDENIAFLNAIRNPLSYVWWLISRSPRIDGARLLELTDFGNPEWDREMHTRLVEMQRKKFPGLIEPLVARIVQIVREANRDMTILNLGAGAMEVERQVIERLRRENINPRVMFVGIDQSPTARRIALENLSLFSGDVVIEEMESVSEKSLAEVRRRRREKIIIIIAANDIFTLDKAFPKKSFDLTFHSLFKHHLNDTDKSRLDSLIDVVSRQFIEFDGFWSVPVFLPQSLVGWTIPAFLNAEILSNLRFRKRRDIQKQYSDKRISFYGASGFYMCERKR